MGCRAFPCAVPHHGVSFLHKTRSVQHLIINKLHKRVLRPKVACPPLYRSFTVGNITGNHPREHATLYWEGGRERVQTPPRPKWGRRGAWGGREVVVAAVLGALLHKQMGKESGSSASSWEEHSSNHIPVQDDGNLFLFM